MNRNSSVSLGQYSLGTDSPEFLSEPRRPELNLSQLKRWKDFPGTSDCRIEEILQSSGWVQISDIEGTRAEVLASLASLSFAVTSVPQYTWAEVLASRERDISSVFGFPEDTVSPIIHSFDFDEIDAIEAFCLEKGIAEWYSKIPGLLENHFPNLEGREFSLQEDDESEDVFVEVLFSVSGDPKKINDYYDMFLDTWVEKVPAQARAYFQLLLDIVE